MTKNDYAFVKKWANKLKAIKMLGGKCLHCGKNNIEILCFHHIEDKEIAPTKATYARWSIAVKELKKCVVMCVNCHSEVHSNEESRAGRAKELLLKAKGIFNCQQCSYQGINFGSLDFHHHGDKKFNLRDFTARRQVSLEDALIEIDKCSVLCAL